MNPTFESRRAAALNLLQATGIRPSNYLPPAIRLLWRAGAHVPPPHFVGFLPTLFVTGATFGMIWGASMWLLFWRRLDMQFPAAAASSGLVGLFFGLAMAIYYAYGRRKYRLPAWASLGPTGSEA